MRICDWSSDVCSSDLTILVDGQALAIRGNDDGSVALVAADGSVARTVAKESFASGGERSTFYVATLLLDRKRVVEGTSVSVRYDRGGRRIIKKKKNHFI